MKTLSEVLAEFDRIFDRDMAEKNPHLHHHNEVVKEFFTSSLRSAMEGCVPKENDYFNASWDDCRTQTLENIKKFLGK